MNGSVLHMTRSPPPEVSMTETRRENKTNLGSVRKRQFVQADTDMLGGEAMPKFRRGAFVISYSR